jgi:ubiquitin-protein ligase
MPELPYEIWKSRVENELDTLRRLGTLEPGSVLVNENQIDLIVSIKALGFKKIGIANPELIPVRDHRIAIRITRAFPYPGGLNFEWKSEIFHPNIDPYETGYICLNVIKKWSRLSDLESAVKALEMLIENPNPDDPLNYPICLEAATFFTENSMEHIREQFEAEEPDDDIIIVDD